MTRTVFITGVLGGIGAATAVEFHAAGWRVVGVDKRAPSGEPPGVDRFIGMDVTDPDIADRLAALFNELESLNAVVNNAAIQIERSLHEMSNEDWDSIISANVRSAFIVSREAFPHLHRTRGAIVNVASVHAIATSGGLSAYAASKGALVALTRSAALEFALAGIRVNAVLPGAVDTPMLHRGLSRFAAPEDLDQAMAALAARIPIGRIGQPAEIAHAILFLADDERSSYVTGQALVVDGGALARLSTE